MAVQSASDNPGFVEEKRAPFSEGNGPVLERHGVVELGPCTVEDGRAAVEELARRLLQLEALVFKQDT